MSNPTNVPFKGTKEQEEKIISTIMNDEVPSNLEKYYE